MKPWLIWLFGQSFAYAALVPVFGILAEIIAVFAGRAIASMQTLAQSLVGIGGLTLVLVLYHAYAGGIGKKPSIVLLVLAVIATIPSVVALALLKKTLWRRAREPSLDRSAALRLRCRRALRDRDHLRNRARDLRQQPRLARDGVRRRARALPALGHGVARAARRPHLLVAEDLRPAARSTRHLLVGMAALHRLQLHLPRPVPARRQGPARGRVRLQRARQHPCLQHDLHDRLGDHRGRRAVLPLRRRASAQRHASGQRPVARRHARVVHHLAAAAAQLRLACPR